MYVCIYIYIYNIYIYIYIYIYINFLIYSTVKQVKQHRHKISIDNPFVPHNHLIILLLDYYNYYLNQCITLDTHRSNFYKFPLMS